MQKNATQLGKSSTITRIEDDVVDETTGLFAAQASRALDLPQSVPNPQAEKISGEHFWKILDQKARKWEIKDFGTVAPFEGYNTDIAFYVLPDGTHKIKAIYSAITYWQEDFENVVAVAQSCPKWHTDNHPSAAKKMEEYLQSAALQAVPSKEAE